MENLKISFAEVQNAADTIRQCSQNIYELLQSASVRMRQLEGSWKSDGAMTIQLNYSQFAAQFDVQREILESYARFLEHTVQTYETLENAINANASSF